MMALQSLLFLYYNTSLQRGPLSSTPLIQQTLLEYIHVPVEFGFVRGTHRLVPLDEQ